MFYLLGAYSVATRVVQAKGGVRKWGIATKQHTMSNSLTIYEQPELDQNIYTR